jgi:uncharacterized protein (DUF1919 family)
MRPRSRAPRRAAASRRNERLRAKKGMVMMKAVDTMQETLLERLDDVPPAPLSYTQYVERTLHDRIQAAYQSGLNRGLLLLGLIIGWIAGFSFATMG